MQQTNFTYDTGWLRRRDAEKFLHVDRATLERWLSEGSIRAYKVEVILRTGVTRWVGRFKRSELIHAACSRKIVIPAPAKPKPPESLWLTRQEAAKFLGVTSTKLKDWLHENRVPTCLVPIKTQDGTTRGVRFRKADLLDAVRKGAIPLDPCRRKNLLRNKK